MTAEQDVAEWLRGLFQANRDRTEAHQALHAQLLDRGLLGRVTLHRYICRRKGCLIATVYAVGGLVFCAVRDYKYSPGLNVQKSVPTARARNTLDGDRHWPGHVYDVQELADFTDGTTRSGMHLVCRHVDQTILAVDMLALVAGVTPGKPGRPTLL